MEENKNITAIGNAVQVIKSAILQSQQRALKGVNQEQLALYYEKCAHSMKGGLRYQ